MGLFRAVLGEFSWTRPGWLRRLGLRRLFYGAGAGLVVLALLLGIRYYLDSLPKPPHIIAQVTSPTATRVVAGRLVPAPLIIDFKVVADERSPQHTVESVARLDLIDQPLKEGLSIAPDISGQWRWVSENRLQFVPADDWPAGQRYRVRYAEALFADDLVLADNRLSFESPAFVASIDELQFYQDPVEHGLRKVVATVSFSHPVDAKQLEDQLRFVMRPSGATVDTAAQDLDYTLSFDKLGRKAFVHSSPITLPQQENYLTAVLARGLAPVAGPGRLGDELQARVTIPDIGSYFRLADVQSIIARNAEEEPVQTLTLEFTDRVAVSALAGKLEAYLLPDTVTVNGARKRVQQLRSPREVTAEVLAQARQLALKLNPAESGVATLHSATLDLPEGSAVYLRIEPGLRSEGGFLMSQRYDNLVWAQSYPREVEIAQSGAILPLSRSRELTFVSRGVSALKVEIGQLLPGQVNHLASQTQGDLDSPYFSHYDFGEDNLTKRHTQYIDLNMAHPRQAVYSSLNLEKYLADGGYYFVTVQGWDRGGDYGVGEGDKRFVLITDLGLLVKTSVDGTQDVFVHSIASGQPVAEAKVQLLGKNGIPIMARATDRDGHAELPSSNGFQREQAPTVYLVRLGEDSVFMPYGRGERQLAYSRFDVGGQYGGYTGSENQLRAQVFTDRGLYRPGDTTHLGAIVKKDDWGELTSLPLILSVRDPRGRKVMSKSLRLPEDGLLSETYVTDPSAATGNYNATLFLLDSRKRRRAIGSADFKVEEFLPDRMRIRSSISGQKPVGWIKPSGLSCDVTLENLFGLPAAGRRVTAELELAPTGIKLPRYPGFVFDDPLRNPNSSVAAVRTRLSDATTNEAGKVSLALNLGQYDRGIYRLTVHTEGFEEGGGRGVRAQASMMMSPLDYLVGYKTSRDLSFLPRDSQHQVEFLSVDSNADRLAQNELTLVVVREQFVSTLVKKPNGTYAYQSILQEEVVSSEAYKLAATGEEYQLPTDQPGRFSIQLKDGAGLVYSKVQFTVAGASNLAGNLERNAELALALDGSNFSPGQEIQMEITAPYTGTGLITIERDQVYAYKWFHAATPTSVQSIRIPDDLEGNAYVNVAFVRAIDSPEIFVSPLSYGVSPFNLDRSARTVEVELDVPKRVRPGTELSIGLRTSKPARVIVYAVDEGILQVANYSPPKPLAFFLSKMALQVDTYQMADLILPDFAAFPNQAAPGGGAAAGKVGKNLNPFRRRSDRAVAFWSGPLDAGPKQRSLSFEVPDYFSGELRVMAVAVNSGAVGSAVDTTVARGPFVITPNVLTVAAPGDEFEVNVGLANSLEGSGPVARLELAVSPSEHLEILGQDSVQLDIPEGREGRAQFRVRVRDKLGPATLQFEARSGAEHARRQATMSVRPAVGYVTTVASGVSNQDPLSLQYERRIYDDLASQRVAASASPLILVDGLLSYLDSFPHACAEQIVSKVFPMIGLLGSQDYQLEPAKISEAFNGVIQKLRGRQTAEGGFLFWSTSAEAAEFPSVYILHFLTDAKALNLAVPKDMLSAGLNYLRNLAAQEVSSLSAARLRAYAIYVLTRNGTVTTNYLTNLHESLDREQPDTWRRDLTAMYMAASYRILQQEQLGQLLIDGYPMGERSEMDTDFDTRLGRDAQYIYLLARHFPKRVKDIDAEAIRSLVQPVMQNRFNTLSSAYTVLALAAYSSAIEQTAPAAQLTLTAQGEEGRSKLGSPAYFARAQVANGLSSLSVVGANGQDVFYTLAQSGFDRQLPKEALSEGLEVDRVYLNESEEVVDNAKIGAELTVRLRVRSTGKARPNVAVVDLLPGGFEILTNSIREQKGRWQADYQDVREDRLVVYGGFGSKVTELRYRVKLTSAGTFVVPSAYAGSMYDRSIQARSAPGRFVVSPLE